MKKIDKEVQRIIREYKLTPSKLLFVEDVKQEEINTWFENIKEDLINYIQCSLKLENKWDITFEQWTELYYKPYNAMYMINKEGALRTKKELRKYFNEMKQSL